MKKIIRTTLLLLFLQAGFFAKSQSVAINEDGTTADASSILDVKSTTKGLLVPRVTTAQRTAIAVPAKGLLVFDVTTNSFWFRNASSWVELADSTGNVWKKNTSSYVFLNSNANVGIGTAIPGSDLTIYRPSPSIALYDAVAGKDTTFSGSIVGDSLNMVMNAFRRTQLIGGTSGNILLQLSGSSRGFPIYAGNVGIGIDTPKAKLHVLSTMMVGAGTPLSGYEFNVTGDAYFSKTLMLGTGTAVSGYEFNVNGDAHVEGNTMLRNNGEALKIDGVNPFIQLYQNGVAKSYIYQTGNNLQIGNSNGNNTGNLVLYGNQIAIGTGTPATGYKLSVAGKVICEELKVQLQGNWPDYVFSDKYKLEDLNKVEAFIKENKHLPNIPSADAIGNNGGVEVGEMQRKMMEKIEELTLYIIDLKKQVDELKSAKSN